MGKVATAYFVTIALKAVGYYGCMRYQKDVQCFYKRYSYKFFYDFPNYKSKCKFKHRWSPEVILVTACLIKMVIFKIGRIITEIRLRLGRMLLMSYMQLQERISIQMTGILISREKWG